MKEGQRELPGRMGEISDLWSRMLGESDVQVFDLGNREVFDR